MTLEHDSAFSRRDASEFCWKIPYPRKRGRRECRAPNAPAAWQGRKTSHASKVTTVTPEITRHSPRNGFNGFLRALPGDRAFLPPSPAKVAFRQLDTSVGVSGPHDFAVRLRRVRQSAIRVHRIPPRVDDVAQRPSVGGTEEAIPLICCSENQNIFHVGGLTGFGDLPVRQNQIDCIRQFALARSGGWFI